MSGLVSAANSFSSKSLKRVSGLSFKIKTHVQTDSETPDSFGFLP